MIPIHFTTGTSAPTVTLINFTEFWGCVASNAESATYYLKIYWQANTNTTPIVGTTVPQLTVPISTTFVGLSLNRGLVQNGPMYYAVTKNAADTDSAALSNGGDVITLFVE